MMHKLPRIVQIPLAALALAGAILAPKPVWATAELVAYWDFEKVEADGVTLKSVVGPYSGTIQNSAVLTPAGGGRPGGGKGFDVSPANPGFLLVDATGDANPMNKAAVNDQVSVVLWQKNNNNINSSSYWAVSDTQNRGFQFHIPWSDGTIYFDTMGCCGATQRLQQNVAAKFPDHDFTVWHHYAFIKDGGHKAIYIDAKLLTEGDGYDPLTTDFIRLSIGAADRASPPDAVIDDFAIYKGVLSVDDLKALVGGARPGEGVVAGPLKVQDTTPSAGAPRANFQTPVSISFLNGTTKLDTNSVSMKLDTASVTPTNSTQGDVVTYTYQPASVFAAQSSHTVAVSYADTSGGHFSTNWSFTVQNYVTLDPSQVVTPDTTKPGFIWEMSQVDSVGSYAQNSNARTIAQLAGLIGPNIADPNAQGVAVGPGKPNANPNLPIDFEIPTIIALDRNGSAWGGWGTQTGGDQMPGSPGTGGGTDNQAARIITYVDLPAGVVKMGVNSDDGFLTAAGYWNDVFTTQLLGQFDGGRGPGDTTFTFAVPKAGVYPLYTLWENGGGGADIAWFAVINGKQVALNDTATGGFKAYRAVTGAARNVAAGRTVSPLPGATGVHPAAKVYVELVNGATPIDKSTVSLMLDNATVPATVTQSSNVTFITYSPTTLFASASTHTATLLYTEAGTQVNRPWQFTVYSYTFTGVTKDKVHGYSGLLMGKAQFTADTGGHSGKAGDFGMDLTTKGGPVQVLDPSFMAALNAATANDEMSVSLWVKKYDIADSSAFWFSSPSQSRVFQAHTPWSNNNIYFDTAGCCGGDTRINDDVSKFAGYTGDIGWWTNNWHLLVFTKKADQKNIYIDGQVFLNGSNSGMLSTDVNQLNIGADNSTIGGLMHAIVDDFAVYAKELSAANVTALNGGTKPTDLPAAVGLLAYWDFEDAKAAPPTGPKLTIARSAGGLTVTFTGALQSSTNVAGPYTDVSAATSPLTISAPLTGSRFYRSKQ